MTGGTVVVLGTTGRNFAAGMSGGIAYVYDENGDFAKKCNTSMCVLEAVAPHAEQEKTGKEGWHSEARGSERETDEAILKRQIERHFKFTGSTRARNILDDWNNEREKFVKVLPTEYKRALGELWAAAQTAGAPKASGKPADKVAA